MKRTNRVLALAFGAFAASAGAQPAGCPGMKEAGLPEYSLEFWYGMFVPAGTPPASVKMVYDATIAAMPQSSVKAALAREGTEVSLSASSEDFAGFLIDEGGFWANRVKSAYVEID